MRLPQANDRQRAIADNRAAGLDVGMTVTSYLIGGLIAYGFIGWLIGKAAHVGWTFPAGMLLGLVISTGYVIHRYGRAPSDTTAGDDPRGNPRRENR
jgi:ATP synthase protein I